MVRPETCCDPSWVLRKLPPLAFKSFDQSSSANSRHFKPIVTYHHICTTAQISVQPCTLTQYNRALEALGWYWTHSEQETSAHHPYLPTSVMHHTLLVTPILTLRLFLPSVLLILLLLGGLGGRGLACRGMFLALFTSSLGMLLLMGNTRLV